MLKHTTSDNNNTNSLVLAAVIETPPCGVHMGECVCVKFSIHTSNLYCFNYNSIANALCKLCWRQKPKLNIPLSNAIYIIIHSCVSNNDGAYSWIIHELKQFGKEAKVLQNQVHNHDRRTKRLRNRRERERLRRRDSMTNWRKEMRGIRKAEKGEQERETDATLTKW